MSLIIEDGSIVPGANTYAGVQEAAAFHALRGGLIPVSEVTSVQVTFSEGGILTSTDGTWASIPEKSIVQVLGAATGANVGFGHVRSVSGTQLSLAWLNTVAEAAGPTVTVVIYEQSGWWHAAPSRLEASLVNAASFMAGRYVWAGQVLDAEQALAWPRGQVPSPVAGFLPSESIPEGVVRCQLWLSLADIEAPLMASVDPQDFLVSKSIGSSGIDKTFGGKVRLRRHPHADAEVLAYLATADESDSPGSPFRSIVRI